MKCDVIENVVDCAAIQHSCDALLPLELCQYLEKQSQNTIITMIARYDPVKNYPLALEAASKVLEKKEQCAFIFVGIDPNCIEFKKLKQSFPERIFGVQYLPKPSAIIVRSTITMLTSKKEGGLPLVIQEAFCLGKTVVATEVAGTRELVEHGVNGLLCDESAQSIADAIITIAQDKALLSKLSRGARLTAEKRDVKSWSQRYFDLYYRHASFGACQ
jgi:glycosyltransferase involved in cell wall biosynthesis